MKKLFALMLCGLILTGCTGKPEETRKPTRPTDLQTTEALIETEIPTTETPEQSTALEIVQMTVYVPDENAISFEVITVEGEALTFLEGMIEAGVLNDDIQVNSIAREDDHLMIDFNQAFRDLVCTMGTSGERMIIGSVVNTLIVNYEVDSVSITVDGDVWESGHVIYDFPMGFFE